MTITEMHEKAVQMAEEVFSVKLNYQAGDLETIEQRIMPVLEKQTAEGKINPVAAENLAVFYGAYLGEVMLREFAAEKGYRWERPDENGLPYLTGADGKFNPIAKVYKRITEGNGDDIRSFYRVAQAIVSGKLKTT